MAGSDEWLSTGNCDICRRKPYCNKPCNAAKRRVTFRAAQIFADMMTQGVDEYLKTHGGVKK